MQIRYHPKTGVQITLNKPELAALEKVGNMAKVIGSLQGGDPGITAVAKSVATGLKQLVKDLAQPAQPQPNAQMDIEGFDDDEPDVDPA
jgi:hypothetical protein